MRKLRIGGRRHCLKLSYLLIAAELVYKSPRSCTDLPTFIVTFFADLYIKLSRMRKHNKTACLALYFW